MRLDQWLDLNDGRNLRRVAELMTVNHGQLKLEGNIGSVLQDPKINRYGRLGLTLNEAFELQYYCGIIDALTNAHGNPEAVGRAALARIAQEVQGEVIEIASPEKQRLLLGGK